MSLAEDPLDAFFIALHGSIRDALESLDGRARFLRDAWTRGPHEPLQGRGESAVLEGGAVLERAGVMWSRIEGRSLPPAATQARPELVGKPYVATGVSVVVHPGNPYAPTSHMNVRAFRTVDGSAWWFGGGFDLTPIYPFHDDVIAWHRAAKDACDPFGAQLYPALKARCDEYFFLKHRGETRGVGGLFFDDLSDRSDLLVGDHARCFAFTQAVGQAYRDILVPLLRRRKDTPFTERERHFQLLRRGRYVEFNLVFDRGTLFGLQSHGRTESILASMPPLAAWSYDHKPEPGSPEAALADYLRPRDWLGGG